jgi:hypothetical protein
MRTAQQIEENLARSSTQGSRKQKGIGRGNHPNSRKQLKPQPWPKGVSGNPGGLPGYDVAAKIARKVFELNEEAIYTGMAQEVIDGKPYAFDVVANRGFGKMKETVEHRGLEALAEVMNKLRKQKHGDASSTDASAT